MAGPDPASPAPDPAELAERVAAAVIRVPGVVALHPGAYGDVLTYLPGRRLAGVRIGRPSEPVEVGLVVGLDRPIPDVVVDVRAAVAGVCGDRPVDVTVADVREAP
ncbi:hypothetical protein SAMN05443637_10921 [Pseudonocardia thermophila]|uniref:Asp23 family, cell envelope-related function n=1 Tax=Pseudonocardia thermophila TaxID=1848 RepID=A0A1M6TYM6_PSETH|nr:hypothetical protein [Pseudonocardia thermophila]SHK61918.1 hypothetical protein SAMN05443637_10921 [Pseudonocardia thermophila]